jgi:ferredoxin-thioredoxin reductase catalytic subunit
MSPSEDVTGTDIDRVYKQIKEEAEAGGYHLNPDIDMDRQLINGLLVNEKRYGYRACPCRLASGKKEDDLDIICPCDYRDADVSEYGACYCSLYVSRDVADGRTKAGSIPERRPPREKRMKAESSNKEISIKSLPLPVWRCKVCGYLCAREGPPEVCPICKARKERFERFM